MTELNTKDMLAVASIAAGLGCIAAGIVQQNGSVLAVGAGLLGAPGIAKGAGSESVPVEEGPSPASPDSETGSDTSLDTPPVDTPVSGDESYGGLGHADYVEVSEAELNA